MTLRNELVVFFPFLRYLFTMVYFIIKVSTSSICLVLMRQKRITVRHFRTNRVFYRKRVNMNLSYVRASYLSMLGVWTSRVDVCFVTIRSQPCYVIEQRTTRCCFTRLVEIALKVILCRYLDKKLF